MKPYNKMDFDDESRYITRPSMRSQVESIELLFVPENRCTDWTWPEVQCYQFYDTINGSFTTLHCTPNLEPVMPRYMDDNGKSFDDVSSIELYYTWKQLDKEVIDARREQLKKLREEKEGIVKKPVSTSISDYKQGHEKSAKDFFDFVKKHYVRLSSVRIVGDLKEDHVTKLTFNPYDDRLNVYGIGNVSQILMQAKLVFRAVDKPFVKLSLLKEKLEEMHMRQRRVECEYEYQNKQLAVLQRELLYKEAKVLSSSDNLDDQDIEDLESEIVNLKMQVDAALLRVKRLLAEKHSLEEKIPLLQAEVTQRMENGGKPVAVELSTELQYIMKVIKMMNKWNHNTFTFLDCLNAYADSFKPVEAQETFFEELKKQNVVLNVRGVREPRPTPLTTAAPAASAASTASTARAVLAVPVAPVAPAVPVAQAVPAVPVVAPQRRPAQQQQQPQQQQPQQQQPQQQQPQRQARPVQSRLARLGVKP